MHPVWRCLCGFEEEDQPGSKRPIQGHVLNGSRVDGKGVHELIGLFDADTEECLYEGRSRKQALERKLITDGDAATAPQQGQAQQTPAQPRPTPQSRKGSYIRGNVPFRNVQLPPGIEGYFGLALTQFPDDFTNDDEGLKDMIMMCVKGFFHEHAAQIFKFDPQNAAAWANVRRIMRTYDRMGQPDDEFVPDELQEVDDPNDLAGTVQRGFKMVLSQLEQMRTKIGEHDRALREVKNSA